MRTANEKLGEQHFYFTASSSAMVYWCVCRAMEFSSCYFRVHFIAWPSVDDVAEYVVRWVSNLAGCAVGFWRRGAKFGMRDWG